MFHICLVYTYANPQSVWTFVDQNGEQNVVRISGRFLANSGDAFVALVLRGAGIMLAPDYLVVDGRPVDPLVAGLRDARDASVRGYPHSHYLSAKNRTFIDFLATRFGHSVAGNTLPVPSPGLNDWANAGDAIAIVIAGYHDEF